MAIAPQDQNYYDNLASTAAASDDHLLSISEGNVPGSAYFLVRGHNAVLNNEPEADIWEPGGDLVYLTSAETMNIASTHSSDIASTGNGLHTLFICGVDATWTAIEETVIMSGTNNVLTTNSYLRVNSMNGVNVGPSGWNLGNVIATASSAGTIQDEMDATEGISQSSHYTVPLGKTAYLYKTEFNAAKLSGGGTPEIEFKIYCRPGGTGICWQQIFDKKIDTAVTDELDFDSIHPLVVPTQSDLKIRGLSDTDNTEVRTRLSLLIIDD